MGTRTVDTGFEMPPPVYAGMEGDMIVPGATSAKSAFDDLNTLDEPIKQTIVSYDTGAELVSFILL